MALQFPVKPGTLVRCDYGRGGFVPPEMVKSRPVVIVSPRLPHRDRLCAVVPLSTSQPERNADYVVRLHLSQPLPSPYENEIMWAKCDMIATVSFDRLDLFRTERDHLGKRRYLQPLLPSDDFMRVQQGILAGLGIRINLT
jgi:mRNA interferase MazF